jgi:aryl-alcohol dehydrogenase-like predicted oxidoreductase
LAGLGVPVGISLSGPGQSEALRRALAITVDGRQLFSAVQATWNLLEPSVGPALAEAKSAGWTVMVKEALANGRLATPGLFPVLGDQPDVTALAAALARPWADVVLSGAATVSQLASNLRAREAVPEPDGERFAGLAVDPQAYWAARSSMPWT